MDTKVFISKEGHFYVPQKSLFKTSFLRVGDNFVYPRPETLRIASPKEMGLLVLSLDSKVDVPCLHTAKDSMSLNEAGEGEDKPKIGTLVTPSEHFDWSHIVLYPQAIEAIRSAVNYIQNRDKLEEVFNISKIDPSAKCLLNFYGAPGTGKTMAAKAVARELNKPLLQADYSQITSKWVGETSKGIKLLFEEAKDRGAVLFLDEADSLASKRLDAPNDSAGVHFNQEKNVFMQELDKFDGIAIMTTNLFQNYDDALLRRIAEHIRFDLPNSEMREKIIRQFFDKNVKIRVNYRDLAKNTEGFSGGDLLNVVKNSIKLASLKHTNPDKWVIDDTLVNSVVKQIREAKQDSGQVTLKRSIGFQS